MLALYVTRLVICAALVCLVTGGKCKLSKVDDLTLEWSIINTAGVESISATVTTSSTSNWFSFAVVKRDLLMIPRSTHRHSVFIFAPTFPLQGRFLMLGTTNAGFPIDNQTRSHSFLEAASSYGGDAGKAYMRLKYTEGTETGLLYPDPKIDISGTNYVMFATGVEWDYYHNDRGMQLVNWKQGTCTPLEGVDPFYAFLVFFPAALIMLFPLLTRCAPFKQIVSLRTPFFEEFSIGGMLVILVHLGLCILVLITNLLALDSTYFAALVATGKV